MRTIDPLDHIRSNREMYLPGGRCDPAYLATRVADDALTLGASRVELLRHRDWWVIAANSDWMARGPSCDVRELFGRVVPFPESGVNSMRAEVLLSAFADDVVTSGKDDGEVIKGNVSARDEIWSLVKGSDRARAVAFRVATTRGA